MFHRRLRGFVVSFERQVVQAGVRFPHSRPYHPQTCGKIERLHHTTKDWLARHPAPADLTCAQRGLDAFRAHYNTHRPHQALDGATPAEHTRAPA